MNRSVERRRFGVAGFGRGEVVVAPFRHPDRGVVRASAAPVVAESVRRIGYPARVEWEPLNVTAGTADGVVLAVSYLERSGAAVGFGAAVHRDDLPAMRAAEEVVGAWSAVLRTRRVLVASPGSACLAGDGPCEHVGAARAEVERFVQRGDQVVMIGAAEPATTPGVVAVGSVEEVVGLRLDPDRVSYVVWPGMVVEEADRVIAALHGRYPRVRGAHPAGLCHAASDWAGTVRAVAGSCDTMFVLGAAGSPDVAGLAALAGTGRAPVHVVDEPERMRPRWLAGAACVGLATAPSAGPGLDQDVIDALSGLGPLALMRRQVLTEHAELGAALVSGRPPPVRARRGRRVPGRPPRSRG